MQLSPHFNLKEMTVSQTAARRGIDNTPSEAVIKNLTSLCVNVLEPVRAQFGKPVIVTSGYRSADLNKRIGGSTTSQHCFGQAADFTVHGVPNVAVLRFIQQELRFDQLICEFHSWIHVSFAGSKNRFSSMKARKVSVNGRLKTEYSNTRQF